MRETLKIQPITPIEAIERSAKEAITRIPVYVIVAANELIVKNLVGGESTFTLKELVKEVFNVVKRLNIEIDKDHLFKNNLLDIEATYREQGWIVKFDKPGYNEDYDSYFVFSFKR